MLLSLIALASWGQYVPVSCIRHLHWAMTPGFAFLVLMLFIIFKTELPLKMHVVLRFVFFLILVYGVGWRLNDTATKIYSGYFNREKYGLTVAESPLILKGMIASKDLIECMQKLDKTSRDYLKKYPESGIVNLTPYALFGSFIPGLSNPHPLTVNWNYLEKAYPDYIHDIYKYTQNNKSLIIIGGPKPILIPGGYDKKNYSKIAGCFGVDFLIPEDRSLSQKF